MRFKLLIPLLLFTVGMPVSAELRLQGYTSGVFERAAVNLEEGERLVSQGREQIRETSHVMARLGSKFGIRYQVSGKQKGSRVTYLYLTPGVEEPDGTRHDKYEEVIELSPDSASHVAAFEFTEQYEVVTGTWEVMIFEGDRLLVRSRFTVSVEEEDLTPRITPVQFDD
ncbi:DUF3859 domain-containing protein [Porticoccus sp. W117]|uniref:DUF3859 domain-containing protein n=1 Tax=Porticoccus sp. W117 TaxID=3054777 RepID=UPI0025962D5D|nr:DUF3859 domain-containing protein [Porticoccus sp. W117]MDM3871777.1 DUF3859 domain-containing protein [Porticoccus sp. W117]